MSLKHSEFFLRPYHPAYAREAVAMINASAARTLGAPQAVVDDLGILRLARYVPPSGEKVIVIDAQNRLAGFAYCADLEQSIVYGTGGAVHPDFWGRGIGSMLVEWAERRAAEKAFKSPTDIRVVLQVSLFRAQSGAIRLFEGAGFHSVRTWAHLVIDLTAPPGAAELPQPLTLREMDLDNDWDLVGPAMDEAFMDHWGAITMPTIQDSLPENKEPSQEDIPEDESYSNAPGFCFIAMDGDGIAGGVLCNKRLVERGDTGRIGSLFVRPHYQHQGVGRALMLAAFNAFWQTGVKRIITDTDAESFSDAPKFYANLGMQLYRQEFLYEKEIRPGREVRHLSPVQR